MKKKHASTLRKLFAKPVSGSIHWADIESLFIALGARIFHRLHPFFDAAQIVIQAPQRGLWSLAATQ